MEILTAHYSKCGKGDRCTVLDLRIRNPTNRPLWLMVDGDHPFGGWVESVSILQPRSERQAPVWLFSGQSYNEAYRLMPGTDVIVRNLEFFKARAEYNAAFVDRIELDYDRHVNWIGTDGALPLYGDLDAERGGVDSSHRKEPFRLTEKERVSLDTWCTERIPIRYDAP